VAKQTGTQFVQLMHAENIDIGHSGWIVLSRLWEEDRLSQQEISDRSGVAKPNISNYIDQLEKEDYLVRVDDPADGPNYKIYMMPACHSRYAGDPRRRDSTPRGYRTL
jgi:DNA-binding MarR family transcriptional regulator